MQWLVRFQLTTEGLKSVACSLFEYLEGDCTLGLLRVHKANACYSYPYIFVFIMYYKSNGQDHFQTNLFCHYCYYLMDHNHRATGQDIHDRLIVRSLWSSVNGRQTPWAALLERIYLLRTCSRGLRVAFFTALPLNGYQRYPSYTDYIFC